MGDQSSDGDVTQGVPRWVRIATSYGVLLAAALNANLPGLMTATGAPGAVIQGLAYLPLFSAAVAAGRSPFERGPLRALAMLVALMGLSVAWTNHPLDGAVRLSAIATTLAWAALFARWPSLLGDALHAGLVCCVIGELASLAGVSFIPAPNSSFALFILFVAAVRWGRPEPGTHVVLRAARSLAMLGLLALTFLSSFRAPTIAAGLVLLALAPRTREARLTLVAAAVLGALFFAQHERDRAPSYSRRVEREDLVARYESISEDRLSGRTDIWEGVFDAMREGPAWLAVGCGVGDVDYIVAAANPMILSYNIRGDRVLSTHNLALEVLVANGVPGLLLLLWLVGELAVRLGRRALDLGMFAGAIVLSASNVTLLDVGGGTACVALLCVRLSGPSLAPGLMARFVGSWRPTPTLPAHR